MNASKFKNSAFVLPESSDQYFLFQIEMRDGKKFEKSNKFRKAKISQESSLLAYKKNFLNKLFLEWIWKMLLEFKRNATEAKKNLFVANEQKKTAKGNTDRPD